MEIEGNSNKAFSIATRKEVKSLLRGGYSHTGFEKVVRDFPIALRGTIPESLPYSAWQVLEHMRIAQRYMLDYARQNLAGNPRMPFKDLRWPGDYWVKQTAPASRDTWDRSIRSVIKDRDDFAALIDDVGDDALITPSTPYKRKTLLRLALQIADHNAYHIGQLVIIRRLLCSWKK